MGEASGKHWLVYMICADDGSYYTGITTDLARRWRQHSGGGNGAKFFRGRKPAALVYAELDHDRSSAARREAAIKSLTRPAKHNLLATAGNVLNTAQGAALLALCGLVEETG
jgi:putative endonuclease